MKTWDDCRVSIVIIIMVRPQRPADEYYYYCCARVRRDGPNRTYGSAISNGRKEFAPVTHRARPAASRRRSPWFFFFPFSLSPTRSLPFLQAALQRSLSLSPSVSPYMECLEIRNPSPANIISRTKNRKKK